jgi:hypothetical protein
MLDIKPSQVVVNLGWVELPKTFFSNPKKGKMLDINSTQKVVNLG